MTSQDASSHSGRRGCRRRTTASSSEERRPGHPGPGGGARRRVADGSVLRAVGSHGPADSRGDPAPRAGRRPTSGLSAQPHRADPADRNLGHHRPRLGLHHEHALCERGGAWGAGGGASARHLAVHRRDTRRPRARGTSPPRADRPPGGRLHLRHDVHPHRGRAQGDPGPPAGAAQLHQPGRRRARGRTGRAEGRRHGRARLSWTPATATGCSSSARCPRA